MEATCTELGCMDFQDLLSASRLFVASYHEFNETDVPAPWQPDMTEEQLERLYKAQERAWDRAMGV